MDIFPAWVKGLISLIFSSKLTTIFLGLARWSCKFYGVYILSEFRQLYNSFGQKILPKTMNLRVYKYCGYLVFLGLLLETVVHVVIGPLSSDNSLLPVETGGGPYL